MSEHALSLSTKDIIDIVNWLRDYHSHLEGLEADVSPVLTDDIDRLLQVRTNSSALHNSHTIIVASLLRFLPHDLHTCFVI